MKKISIIVPCYKEEPNIEPMADALTQVMKAYEGKYDYEILFRDNASPDNTLSEMKKVAERDKHIKVIVNARNYGVLPGRDTFIGRLTGDAILYISADFQDPPELIHEFIKYWEKGYEAVCGQKYASKEGRFKYGLRQLFYNVIDMFTSIPQYRNVSGMYLLSRKLYEYYSAGDMDLRFFLADVGCDVKLIRYEQQKRRAGRSSYNIWRSLSFAIYSLISISTAPLRLATVIGFIMSILSFLVGLAYLIYKLVLWDRFDAGAAPILIGVFFIGSILLFFLGILGEYIGVIYRKVAHKNPTFVKELINFDNAKDDPYLYASEISDEK
ncbi:MAG: glycosyltransferase family 2 protein [Lachnospiraceae bacterium]|nr:glycosyltransferase family 2 protein [Lachnospiraceae bacterium]